MNAILYSNHQNIWGDSSLGSLTWNHPAFVVSNIADIVLQQSLIVTTKVRFDIQIQDIAVHANRCNSLHSLQFIEFFANM